MKNVKSVESIKKVIFPPLPPLFEGRRGAAPSPSCSGVPVYMRDIMLLVD